MVPGGGDGGALLHPPVRRRVARIQPVQQGSTTLYLYLMVAIVRSVNVWIKTSNLIYLMNLFTLQQPSNQQCSVQWVLDKHPNEPHAL